MKIAIVGAGGVRSPLLVHGLAELRPSVGLDELVLFDVDGERLRLISRVTQAMAARHGLSARLKIAESAEEAVSQANFVITSVRVGGAAARTKDEAIALSHGLVGQETVGAGGFA